jgi:two-component system, sensor histidine kinase RpfC
MNTTPSQSAEKHRSLVTIRNIQGLDAFGATAFRKIRERLVSAWRSEPLEFSQILTRYAVGIVITLYAIIDPALEPQVNSRSSSIAILLIVAWFVGFGLLAHLVIWPRRRVVRRTASICADAIALSLLIHYGERSAAIFFPVYLWVILGNGFRFGIGYMYASMAANGLCFILMMLWTPYWRQEWQFSAGLLAAIIVIPIYASSLIRKLRSSMEQAKAASTAKTEFLSMISHELRTPLNAILGLAQVSRITATTPQERENAASTEIAAHRLTRMLDTILKFQAVESGAGRIREKTFDVIDTLAEVEAILAPLAWQKKLKFRFRFQTALPTELTSDPDIIQTIIMNLVTNAIKYTKAGFVIVELALLNREGRTRFRVDVHDSGPGIDPDLQTRIFDQFVRQVPSGAEDEGGVGLGLSLCKSLVGLLGGGIGCTSVRGHGSTFWVEIPAAYFERSKHARPAIDHGIKIAAFGFEALSCAEVAREFRILEGREAYSILACHSASSQSAHLVLIAQPSKLASADQELLRRHLEGAAVATPLIVVDADTSALNELSARATAVVPSSNCVSPELVRTVLDWHGRHLPRADKIREAPACGKRTILVADDNDMNRQVIGRMLNLDGYNVLEARNGDDALDCLLTKKIDLAILDVNMPDQDGVEVCKTYRSVAAREGAAVVVGLTADISEETRNRCLEAGMTDVLSKPLVLEDLRSLLARTDNGNTDVIPISSRQMHPEAAQVLDRERVCFLIELFGKDAFKNDVLRSFETETGEGIERLKTAISNFRMGDAEAVLHSIKSSAKTIGASRLAKQVSSMEESSPYKHRPDCCESIAGELTTFMISCKSVLNHDHQ